MLPEERQIGDLLEQINDNGISHLIIGDIAAILYGLERPAYDIDIAIPENLETLDKIFAILKKMGYRTVHRCPFPRDHLMEIDFVTSQFIKDKGCLEFRNEDKGFFPVDILAVDQAFFNEISGGSIRIPYQDSFIICPNLDTLIKMKEEVGRPQDKEDVKKLKVIHKKLRERHYG